MSSPMAGMLEFVRDVIFDTLFVPENLVNQKGALFCIPVGQYAGRQIKDFEHTNMFIPGMLDAPKKFLIKSFHACIYQHDQPVATSARVWDARFKLESMGEVISDCPLREIADEKLKLILARGERDGKTTSVLDLQDPLQSTKEFQDEIEKSAKYYESDWSNGSWKRAHPDAPPPSRLLLDQQQCFVGKVTFDHPVNVPIEVVLALNGILARAVM